MDKANLAQLRSFITAGHGRTRLGDEEDRVGPGDCVVIAPGMSRKLWNTGTERLVLLCCSRPPTPMPTP
jgi:mannose-6-phosphate isomerase-like protein (cupin superfamily)